MSLRSKKSGAEVARLRADLEEMKKAAAASGECAASADASVASHEFDQLSPTEQAAASLGVSPEAWKPIGFMNNGHYSQLIQSNMLDDSLARRIEAFKVVAGGDKA